MKFNRLIHSFRSTPLISSLVLHGLVLLGLIGMGLHYSDKTHTTPIIDVDSVEVEFTDEDQDLNSQIKNIKRVRPEQKQVSKEKISSNENVSATDKINEISDQEIAKSDQNSNKNLENSETTNDSNVNGETNKQAQKLRMSYDQYLVSYINKYKTYPRLAERLKQQGVVLSKIIIKKDGSLKKVTISKSSGYNSLDQGTINLIKSLAPFKPLPQGAFDEYIVSIPIEYILSGY